MAETEDGPEPQHTPEADAAELVDMSELTAASTTDAAASRARLAGEQFVEPSRIEPQLGANAPDRGTKLFVLFFFLIVPPLGLAVLAAVCWMLFKKFMEA